MTSPNQLDLFQTLPDAPAQDQPRKLVLPFQMSRTIDANRAAHILQVTRKTVMVLLAKSEILNYPAPGVHGRVRISYDSIVEYCNRLHVYYHLPDRRRRLKPGQRYRDQELLPFTSADTMSVTEITKILDIGFAVVSNLIQTGVLEAYQIIINQRGCAWRVYRPSFVAYLDSLHAAATRSASSRVRAPR